MCHFQIRSNNNNRKTGKPFENVSPSSKKMQGTFLLPAILMESWITCDFLPNSFDPKLSYKMRITNHQSLGDPKFPVKPCTPESTSRRDPKTSVVLFGGDWTPSTPEVGLLPRVSPFWVLGFWRGWLTYQFRKAGRIFRFNRKHLEAIFFSSEEFFVDGGFLCLEFLKQKSTKRGMASSCLS